MRILLVRREIFVSSGCRAHGKIQALAVFFPFPLSANLCPQKGSSSYGAHCAGMTGRHTGFKARPLSIDAFDANETFGLILVAEGRVVDLVFFKF